MYLHKGSVATQPQSDAPHQLSGASSKETAQQPVEPAAKSPISLKSSVHFSSDGCESPLPTTASRPSFRQRINSVNRSGATAVRDHLSSLFVKLRPAHPRRSNSDILLKPDSLKANDKTHSTPFNPTSHALRSWLPNKDIRPSKSTDSMQWFTYAQKRMPGFFDQHSTSLSPQFCAAQVLHHTMAKRDLTYTFGCVIEHICHTFPANKAYPNKAFLPTFAVWLSFGEHDLSYLENLRILNIFGQQTLDIAVLQDFAINTTVGPQQQNLPGLRLFVNHLATHAHTIQSQKNSDCERRYLIEIILHLARQSRQENKTSWKLLDIIAESLYHKDFTSQNLTNLLQVTKVCMHGPSDSFLEQQQYINPKTKLVDSLFGLILHDRMSLVVALLKASYDSADPLLWEELTDMFLKHSAPKRYDLATVAMATTNRQKTHQDSPNFLSDGTHKAKYFISNFRIEESRYASSQQRKSRAEPSRQALASSFYTLIQAATARETTISNKHTALQQLDLAMLEQYENIASVDKEGVQYLNNEGRSLVSFMLLGRPNSKTKEFKKALNNAQLIFHRDKRKQVWGEAITQAEHHKLDVISTWLIEVFCLNNSENI